MWNVHFLIPFKLKIRFCAGSAFRFKTVMSLACRYGSSSYLALKVPVKITCCSTLVAEWGLFFFFLQLFSNIVPNSVYRLMQNESVFLKAVVTLFCVL